MKNTDDNLRQQIMEAMDGIRQEGVDCGTQPRLPAPDRATGASV